MNLGVRFTAILLMLCAILRGQTSTISGVVYDASGAVVPGVTVRCVHEDTGAANMQTSNGAGLYSFPSLPAGSYTITA